MAEVLTRGGAPAVADRALTATVAASGSRATLTSTRHREGGKNLVTLEPTTGVERLIKSVDRVRGLAEVFTPANTVQKMLDLLPAQMWHTHPSPTFLEPACGDGNFLVAILDRKLDRVSDEFHAGTLAAGKDDEAVLFHAIEALASIYAVDISPDNVIGGTPGHEIGARDRLTGLLAERLADILGHTVDSASPVMHAARWVVERNIQVGNMLPPGVDGARKREDLPIREYSWAAEDRTVTIQRTTLSAIVAAGDADDTGVMSLFGPPEPELEWQGAALSLRGASGSAATGATAAAGAGRGSS